MMHYCFNGNNNNYLLIKKKKQANSREFGRAFVTLRAVIRQVIISRAHLARLSEERDTRIRWQYG